MIDYEGVADAAAKKLKPKEQAIPPDQVRQALEASRPVYPLNDPRYQGIAAAKGYSQDIKRLERVRYKHEAMIDAIMVDPTITIRALAKMFGTSEAWLSTVYGSDAFQAALARRRDELLDPMVIASMEDRFKGLVHQSLSVITEKLEKDQNVDLALKGLEIGTKALGFGARDAGKGQTNQFIIQLPPKSENAEAWSRQHNPQNMKQLPSGEDHG